MKCSKCRTINRSRARFCSRCGRPLRRVSTKVLLAAAAVAALALLLLAGRFFFRKLVDRPYYDRVAIGNNHLLAGELGEAELSYKAALSHKSWGREAKEGLRRVGAARIMREETLRLRKEREKP